MSELSAVIITFNEEKKIAQCISSVKEVADEILVVDSFSTDRTVEICRQLGAKVVQHFFEGHIQQKNFALLMAKNNWVLSLDADEMLSDELKKSILALKNNFTADGYFMNRLSNYCGQWIKHGGWYPDKKIRLLDKTKARWGGINPHDKIEMKAGAKIIHLDGDILHYSYNSIEEHLEQTKKFSSLSADGLFNSGKKTSFLKIYFSPVFKFIQTYFFNLGIFDGYKGFVICKMAAYSNYLKYQKLYRLNKS